MLDTTPIARLIEFPRFDDQRGSLVVAQEDHLPFPLRRVFFIFGVPVGATRGGHAHKRCEEVIVAAAGSFDVLVDNGRAQQTFHLDDPTKGLHVRPGVFCELTSFSEGSLCLVYASVDYEAEDHIDEPLVPGAPEGTPPP
jgi:hypothetical protein